MSGHHHFSRLRSEVLARPGAAVFAFRDFDALSYDMVPAVRSYTVVDPVFGAVTFAAVLRTDDVVEIVGFAARSWV